MSQLTLPIAWSQRGEAERLLVTSSNADALALLRDWPRWRAPCALLVGPRGSGRSLIGRLFEAESGGVLVDDADAADETRLFNLWNEAQDSGRPLLLVAAEAPPLWRIALPDLRTRLATAPIARILPPDEQAAAALVAFALERAGSAFAPDMPDFVARRVSRCYEALGDAIACLNAESLASGRKLSVASARAALEAGGIIAADVGQDDKGTETGG